MAALFVALLAQIYAVNIQVLNQSAINQQIAGGWSFVLAVDSNDFEYTQLVRNFKNAAHLSVIQANFSIIDVSVDSVQPEVFNASQFPCVFFSNNGVIRRIQYRGFDEEYLIAFFTTNAVKPPQTITTKEELNNFYASTGVGLIIAFDGASPETYPEFVNLYLDHYAEVIIAFASASLFEKEGFYLYRYIDSAVVPLGDLTGKSYSEVAKEISQNLLPEFTRLSGALAGYYEDLKSRFVILMLIMEDFYLTPEQLELARNIKKQTGLNVTYADVENSQTLSVNYGLPDSLDSTMSVIDHTKPRTMKYMLSEALNLENAVKLVKAVEAGKATPYFKSETEGHSSKVGCQITSISAKTLQNLVKSKKTAAIALYISSHDPMEEFVNATEIAKTAINKDAVYGKFSLNTNDWPLEEFNEKLQFPILYVLKNGKNVYVEQLGNTTEAVTVQITQAFNTNTEL